MLIYLYLHLNLYCHILYGKSENKEYIYKDKKKKKIRNRLDEAVLMMYHKICSYGEIGVIIP